MGLGAMGLPMAKNLVARGFSVRGYDLRQSAREALVAEGGRGAASVAEAAREADALVLMVVNATQAEAALFEQGGLEALPQGAAVVLMSTCPPAAVEKLAERVTGAGRRFVDAPVSGGMVGAIAGSLTIMAAAPAATLAAVRPVLDALGSKVVHVGEHPGQGAMVKTVNQLLCGVHIAVAAEALSLAGKVGIDREVMLDVLGGSAASSWMLRDRGPRMIQAQPEVTSAVDIFVKDLGIVLEAGRDTKAALPLAAVAHQMFLATSGRGDGAADDSQVIRAYQALNRQSTTENR
ncbi:3-hydroxyisobutyrate dehydrogenase (plasmid) [Azoarcus sp. KH32C]|nr:3-hydroxyisobutyrate dehydrogenase [Azoarcus sp. KH32C]